MTEKACVLLNDDLAEYHFGQNHPFGPKRYWAFKEEFERRGLNTKAYLGSSRSATLDELMLFHTLEYIQKVIRLSDKGNGFLDSGDTPARSGIYEAACTVVGNTLTAIDNIMSGECKHAFSPIAGLHHASRQGAAGFCVFNDCGIAIEYLRDHYQIKRVAYIDIDAHHGDGVFYAFEDDADVCIIDFHQNGNTLYPGTGFSDETGTGIAVGTKLNIPLLPDCTDDLAIKLWQSVEPFLIRARPEFILLQCGADSLKDDPITQLSLSSKFHSYVTTRLCSIASQQSNGRLLAMGGGGYNLENIKIAWNDVVEALYM